MEGTCDVYLHDARLAIPPIAGARSAAITRVAAALDANQICWEASVESEECLQHIFAQHTESFDSIDLYVISSAGE